MGQSILEVKLPAGFTVLSAPSEADVRSDLGHYERKVSVSDDTLKILINGRDFRASVPPGRYGEVQSYFDKYLKATEESVVVKKK